MSARILVGVSGGIAAYKACELVRRLVRDGHEVIPIVSSGAERFVTAETFAALARRPAGEDLYSHLERADLYVIAPLTANTMAKLAHGLADTVLTEAVLAHRGPLVVAPAMNDRMWSHPATQANAELLRSRGVEFVGPAEGELAEGGSGVGRMAEPREIADRIDQLLAPENGALTGKRVVVTAGGTREPLDAVRFLGNRSSGRMGVALAAEAQRRGARVTLVGANLGVPAPGGVELVAAPTAADMAREVLARADADLVVMAAAVADYRPAATQEGKRPKDTNGWTLELVPTLDVLSVLGDRRTNGRLLVGFAAEASGDGLERARRKLRNKGVDLVVYNDVSRDDIGFDAVENEVVLLTDARERPVARARKEEVAVEILDEVERLLGSHGTGR
ncbi:MAG TPA: bifunctional phosphopantothenoylcysteine decarboxylase/phosphopantothenate--cysteine ligase CoaBC [Gaiellaceae bacterium]|nr:bifunctional phosphopantothenoylcysteine decarboxylase/phosphopantothenate--cysteine ligase CoaBC [Gaiellaceae bacterium]